VSSSLRRGALAATVLAISLAPLAACGVGSDAQTLEVKPDNAATSVGVVKVQNASVITQPKRDAKGPAVVSATLFNNGRTDQVLESVTLPGTGQKAELHAAKGNGPVTVPAGGSVLLGGKGHPTAVLASGRDAVSDGDVQPVVFTFSKTGDVKLDTFVVPALHYFSGYGPDALPTPSQSPSAPASGGASGSPSGSPSNSPSGSATAGGQEHTGGDGAGTGPQGSPDSSASTH
jgi:copper(I)-binding protein